MVLQNSYKAFPLLPFSNFICGERWLGSEHDVHHHGRGGAEVDPEEGGGGGLRQQEPRHRVRGPTAHEAGGGDGGLTLREGNDWSQLQFCGRSRENVVLHPNIRDL